MSMLIKKRLLTKEELKAKDMSNIFGGDNENTAANCRCSGSTTNGWWFCNDNNNSATGCYCSGTGENENSVVGCVCSGD